MPQPHTKRARTHFMQKRARARTHTHAHMHTCTHTRTHTHTCACTCTPTHQHAYVWMGTLCVLSTREHLSGVRLCLCVFRNTCIELKDGRVDKRSRRVLQGPLNNYRRRYLVVYARIGPRQAQCGRCTMLSSEGTSELEFNAFVCGGALYDRTISAISAAGLDSLGASRYRTGFLLDCNRLHSSQASEEGPSLLTRTKRCQGRWAARQVSVMTANVATLAASTCVASAPA